MMSYDNILIYDNITTDKQLYDIICDLYNRAYNIRKIQINPKTLIDILDLKEFDYVTTDFKFRDITRLYGENIDQDDNVKNGVIIVNLYEELK